MAYPNWNNARNALGLACDLTRQVISAETLVVANAKRVKRYVYVFKDFRRFMERWYKDGSVELDAVQEILESFNPLYVRAGTISAVGMALLSLRKMLVVIRRNKKAARDLNITVTKAWDKGVAQDELRMLLMSIEQWLYYTPDKDMHVERLKMKWRLRDVLAAHGGPLPSMDVRKAFEAVWLAGEPEVAYRTWLGEVT